MKSAIFKNLEIGDHFFLSETDDDVCKKTSTNQYKKLSFGSVIYLIIPMTKVFQKETELWIIKNDRTEGVALPQKTICTKIEHDVYYLNEYPYKIAIPEAFGVEHGHATGVDTWRWSYYVCLSEAIANTLYEKLLKSNEEKRTTKAKFIAPIAQ